MENHNFQGPGFTGTYMKTALVRIFIGRKDDVAAQHRWNCDTYTYCTNPEARANRLQGTAY